MRTNALTLHAMRTERRHRRFCFDRRRHHHFFLNGSHGGESDLDMWQIPFSEGGRFLTRTRARTPGLSAGSCRGPGSVVENVRAMPIPVSPLPTSPLENMAATGEDEPPRKAPTKRQLEFAYGPGCTTNPADHTFTLLTNARLDNRPLTLIITTCLALRDALQSRGRPRKVVRDMMLKVSEHKDTKDNACSSKAISQPVFLSA